MSGLLKVPEVSEIPYDFFFFHAIRFYLTLGFLKIIYINAKLISI